MIEKKSHNFNYISYFLLGEIMKLLFKLFKKIIFSSFLLYFYNFVAINYNMVIPINLFTVSFVSIFDLFGLIGLVIFKFFVM